MCLMRFGKRILFGIIVVLMVCIIPVAADSIKSGGNSDNANKPTIFIEYETGKDVGLVKVTHIHYAKSVDKGKPAKTTTCYKLAGWKWSGPIAYTVDPIYPPEYPDLVEAISSATVEWDRHTPASLFITHQEATFPWGVRDYKNSVSYGDYPTDGVIAVTSTWYSRATKTAVESDILFDTNFNWGTGDPLSMDIQNIATHEIGHTLGLNDLYTSSCSAVTMYGYSWEGDFEKSSLELPDITGLQKLYGA
jgi:hypothetical protein